MTTRLGPGFTLRDTSIELSKLPIWRIGYNTNVNADGSSMRSLSLAQAVGGESCEMATELPQEECRNFIEGTERIAEHVAANDII